jgi:PKD repeat protein
MQQTKKLTILFLSLLILSGFSILSIPKVNAADTIILGIEAQSLPDNILRVYTWDGSDYVEVYSQEWEEVPTIHEFDLSAVLPDSDGQYKVMIGFENGETSESSIDWVYMYLNGEPLVINTADGVLGDIREEVIESDGVSYYSTNYQAWIEFIAWSAPVADAGGPYTGYEGQLIELDASGSTGLVSDLIYRWDFLADGTWDYESLEPKTTYLLPDAGTIDILLEVDDGVMTGQTTTTVTVKNMSPSALIVSVDGAVSTSMKPAKILILGDGYSEGDVPDGPLTGTAQVLRNAGFEVEIAPVKSDAWTGDNPSLDDYSLVIILVGANTKSPSSGTVELGDMPASGQTALMTYVMNGGGLIFGEWVSLQIRDYGYYTEFQDLVMLDWNKWDEQRSADVYNVVISHPITSGLPSSFLVPYHWYSSGTARPGATVIIKGTNPHAYDAVLVKDFNAGKVVEFSWANNWAEYIEGLSPWSNDMKTLYVNAATWASSRMDVSTVTAIQNVPLTFNVESSDTGLNEDLTFTYTWGDGETTDVAVPASGSLVRTASGTHAYPHSGTYMMTVSVTDSLGATSLLKTVEVTIQREPVIAEAGPDQTSTEGATVTFDGSGTTYGVDSVVTYVWDFGDGTTASGVDLVAPTHVYADNGVYTVTLTATDDIGQTSADTMTVTVENVSPNVDAGEDASGNVGDILTFTGSATDAGVNDVLTYEWDFGDGETVTGVDMTTATHAYAEPGVYTVTLTVTDSDGGYSSDTATATINYPPVAEAGPDQASTEGATVTFDGSETSDADGDALTYVWDFGDGTTVSGVDLVAPTHVYADNGVYTVTLTVTDEHGASSIDTMTVTVFNVAPTVEAGADLSGYVGDVLTFTGSATDPGIYDVLTYVWDFGDGETASGVDMTIATHAYAAEGTYTVTLTVTDSDGDSGYDTTTATIILYINNPPVADAGPNVTAKKGVPVTFDGSGSYDPDEGDVLTYVWDFGDGATASGVDLVAPTHTYTEAGVYTVTLTVTDEAGESSTDTTTATITAATTPHELKIQARTMLLASKTGIAEYDGTIDAVVYLIDQSLTAKYWLDDSHLSDKWGIKVFIYEGLASNLLETNIAQYQKQIEQLEKLIKVKEKTHKDASDLKAQVAAMKALLPVFEEADSLLAKADEGLAKTALDEASALTPANKYKNSFNNLLKKAKAAYEDGLKDEANGEYTKAILHFKLSWIYSRQAVHVQQGDPNWDCGNGNYYDCNWSSYSWKYDWDYAWKCDWNGKYNSDWKNNWNYNWYSNKYDGCSDSNYDWCYDWGCGNGNGYGKSK